MRKVKLGNYIVAAALATLPLGAVAALVSINSFCIGCSSGSPDQDEEVAQAGIDALIATL